MASRPVQAFFEAQVEEQGGWDVIFERIANGESQTEIAESYGVTQGWLSRIICQRPERKQAFREAKREAAQAYADQAKTIADGMPLDRDAIARGREQIAVRRWLATVYDREQFGDPTNGVQVTVNVGDLHLNALRHLPVIEQAGGSLRQIGSGSGDARAEYEQLAVESVA